MPLLWNMLVAIRIWTQLKQSIPPGLREYYSLIPDPTAGKVTVVARMPSLEIPGLWSTDPTNARAARLPSEKRGIPSQFHASLLAMGLPLAAPSTAMMARNAARNEIRPTSFTLRLGRQYLLGRIWMSLIDHCGLALKKSRHDGDGVDVDNDFGDEEESRFMVAGDMKASDRTPLKMNWVQFVWLALALGASAYDSSWNTKFPYALKDSEDEDFVYLFYEEDRLFARSGLRRKFSYSLRRAFAWYNIELIGECLLPLGRGDGTRVRLDHVTISPELSACRLGMELGTQGCSNIIRGKEPQDCSNPLAAACCWMLYWRRQNQDDLGLLPVSQHLLEYRQRVLCHLKLLDDHGRLIIKVRTLLLAKTDRDVSTQHESDLHAASVTSETTLSHPDLPQSFPTKTEVTGSKRPTEDASPSAHHQSQAEAIVEQLRSSFASSEYVQRHTKLCEQIDQAVPNPGSRLSGTHRWRLQFRKEPKEPAIWEDLWRSLAPQAGRSIKSRSDRDLYGLIPSQLKTEFESAVQSWESDPDGQKASRWEENDGKSFLACVALALTAWDSYALAAWQPHNDLQIVTDRLSKMHITASLDTFSREFKRSRELSHDIDGDHRFRSLVPDFTTGVLNKGLYLAPPENPVSRLFCLREKDAVVYLL